MGGYHHQQSRISGQPGPAAMMHRAGYFADRPCGDNIALLKGAWG